MFAFHLHCTYAAVHECCVSFFLGVGGWSLQYQELDLLVWLQRVSQQTLTLCVILQDSSEVQLHSQGAIVGQVASTSGGMVRPSLLRSHHIGKFNVLCQLLVAHL